MENITKLAQDVAEVKHTVHKVYTAIAGDEQLGTHGIVHTLNDHSTRIKVLEKGAQEEKNQKKWRQGVAYGGSAVAGAVASHSFKAVLLAIKAWFV